MRQRPFRSSGAAILSAIFLIVVLAALGASMASLTSVQHDTEAKSILAARVYYGAKSGLEWGIQQTISDPAPPARCAPSTPVTLGAPVFQGVTVTVTCAAARYGGTGAPFTYYLVSIATVGSGPGGLGYAERRMEATVSNIP